MIAYPILFHASAEASEGIQTVWNFESQNFKNNCAIPPEFEGPGGALSPEDLFAQALTNCFVATFKVYAENSRLKYGAVSVQTELTVDMNESRKPFMKTCSLKATISGCDNPDRIKMIAEKAFKSGFIINSVKTEMSLTLQVTAAEMAP